jgi:hypothetical protein
MTAKRPHQNDTSTPNDSAPELSSPKREDQAIDSLFVALRHAYVSDELSDDRHEAILAQALGLPPQQIAHCLSQDPEPELDQSDPFKSALDPEIADAEALACALETGKPHPLLALAEALRKAHHPESISDLSHARILKNSLIEETPQASIHSGNGKLRLLSHPRVSVGIALALAAAFTLVWFPAAKRADKPIDVASELALSRSLAPLFADNVPHGTSTDRIDRIVMARSRDLRHNRDLSWRVR